MLYIVSTPIGNLDDLSFRQAKTLISSDVILAEDTRSYQKLLSGIEKIFNLKPKDGQKIISYYKEVEFEKLPEVLELLERNKIVSLISDAGTPLIADPGYLLMVELIKRNLSYDAIPGTSSVTNALVLSGLNVKRWSFLGFLPKKKGEILKLLRSLDKSETYVAFESAQRIKDSLEIFDGISPDSEVVILREMTKKFQEVLRGKPAELSKKTYRGELTLVFKLNRGEN